MKKTRIAGIYAIKNIANGRIYVGSACNLIQRKHSHFWHLKKNKHQNSFLQRDYNKCGKGAFKFETLKVVDNQAFLIQTEQEYLNQYYDHGKTCYNICPTAKSRYGTRHSKKTKEKMSNAWTKERKNALVEQSKKLGLFNMTGDTNPFYGKHHSEKTKQVLSASRKGISYEEKFGPNRAKLIKQKLSIANVGRIYPPFSDEMKLKCFAAQKSKIEIFAIKPGITLKFPSIRNAAKKLSLTHQHIIDVLKKRNLTHKGWMFQYATKNSN